MVTPILFPFTKKKSGNKGDLIVPFLKQSPDARTQAQLSPLPCHPEKNDSTAETRNNLCSVTFAEFSCVYIFKVVSQQKNIQWFSPDDIRRFRQEYRSDTAQMKINFSPMLDSITDHDVHCRLGLSHMSSSRLRSMHRDAILFEQKRQLKQKLSDLERLRQVSEAQSEYSKYWAIAVAVAFWDRNTD